LSAIRARICPSWMKVSTTSPGTEAWARYWCGFMVSPSRGEDRQIGCQRRRLWRVRNSGVGVRVNAEIRGGPRISEGYQVVESKPCL
jgi:hypothetical protein